MSNKSKFVVATAIAVLSLGPYTVPQSPETPVSPASPGSVFGNG
jgi:hypothetical protein